MGKILITGAAGFIGSTLADRLLSRGDNVVAIDDFNSHYNPKIKLANIKDAILSPKYVLFKEDIRDFPKMAQIIMREKPETVVHIAGYTGMKTSIADPETYYSNNCVGTYSILEAVRTAKVTHFIFISTSTVYGDSTEPASEDDTLPSPCNPYAASKVLGEKTVKSYSDIFDIDCTILRLYTVYGPRQRSEMAISKFTRLMMDGEKVPIYGDGSAFRDYLFVDNCVDALIKAIDRRFKFEIINIGEQRTITLSTIVTLLSKYLNKPANIEPIPNPAGIPEASYGNIAKAKKMLDYEPRVSFEEGLARFVQWYQTNSQ